MLARSPEPEAQDKVPDDNPDQIGIYKCWFLRRGEDRSARRKTSQSKEENQQQTQPTYDAGSGNRTRGTLVGGERSHNCANPASQPLAMVLDVLKYGENYSCMGEQMTLPGMEENFLSFALHILSTNQPGSYP